MTVATSLPQVARTSTPVVTVHDVVSLPPETPEIVAHRIDVPRRADSEQEYALSFGGWVLGKSAPVAAVELIATGRVMTTSVVRLVRPGVTAAYPDHPEACGYWFRAGVLGMPSEFRLTLRAVLGDGSRVPLGYVVGRRLPVRSDACPTLAPLMVTSLGRMGTTWLMRLLAEHPSILVHREYPYELMAGRYWMHQLRVLSAPFDRDASPHPDTLGSDLWRIGANPSYGPMLGGCRTLSSWLGRAHVERLATFCQESIDTFYGLLAQEQSQPAATFFAEKYLPDQLPALVWELYPRAKEVFLVRDIRDAVCSMLAFNAKRGYQSFGRGQVPSDAAFVRRLACDMAILAQASRSREGRSHLVRYEDLVADPGRVIAGILEYAGLGHDVDTVHGMVERSSTESPELAAHRTSENPAASIGRWRRDLPRELVAECAEAFTPILDEFGYDPTPT